MTIQRRQLLIATLAASASSRAVPAPLPGKESDRSRTSAPGCRTSATQPLVRNTRGTILYIGDDGKERGREWFGFSWREDGQITLRAYCEIDDTRVERDVVQSMTSDFRPLDCFVRIHVRGRFTGSGWIRVTPTEAECEVYSTIMGRVHQQMPLATPATTLVSHPISADAVMLSQFNHSKAERTQSWRGGLATSTLADGGSGPFLSVDGERFVEYVGPEPLTTSAGAFDTHHYKLLLGPRGDGAPRSYDLWCTHPDFIVVRAEVRGYLGNRTGYGRYELVEYQDCASRNPT